MTDADGAGAGQEQEERVDPPVPPVEGGGPEESAPVDPWAPPVEGGPKNGVPTDGVFEGGAPGGGVPGGGVPGGNPYAYPPFPMAPEYGPKPEVNGLAISSLVLGLMMCLWPAALVLGITALVKMRRRPQRGRGLAIAGTVLGMVGMFGTVFGIAAGAIHARLATSSGPFGTRVGGTSGSSFAWQPGDCFTERRLGGDLAARGLTSCDKPHYGEVFFRTSLPGTVYPGTDAVMKQAGKLCSTSLHGYLSDPWARPYSVVVSYIYPRNETEWERSKQTAVCFLREHSGANRTGSLRLDGTKLTMDQQYLLQALGEMEYQVQDLQTPVSSPADATDEAASAVEDIQQALTDLSGSNWSDAAKDRVATLTTSLRGDLAAWQAVRSDSDPVGAFQRALKDSNPLDAEVAARRAFGLTDHNLDDPDAADTGGGSTSTGNQPV
jgi:hypothetical protein